METEKIKVARWIVAVPPGYGYANALLNGERVLMINTNGKIANTIILTGRYSGRSWQFCHDHLRLA